MSVIKYRNSLTDEWQEITAIKGDPGPKGDPGDASVSQESITTALGYTPGRTLTSESHNNEIENLFPDKITVAINNFYRYGNICQFVWQITVAETITTDQGANIAKLPFVSVMRCWLNNSTDFYIDGNGQYIKRNGTQITAGDYTLSGMYITT